MPHELTISHLPTAIALDVYFLPVDEFELEPTCCECGGDLSDPEDDYCTACGFDPADDWD